MKNNSEANEASRNNSNQAFSFKLSNSQPKGQVEVPKMGRRHKTNGVKVFGGSITGHTHV